MENIDTTATINTTPAKVAGSNTWIGVGYLTAVLGGFLGIAIGLNYRSKKYNDQTRRHGLYIIIIGFVIMFIAKAAMNQR